MAPFEGQTLEAGGRSYTLLREGDAFYVDMVDLHWERAQAKSGVDVDSIAEPKRTKARVVMTTGSHYMQTFWVEAPPGRKNSAVVTRMAPSPGRSGITLWTVPLPKVWSPPTITARR